MDKLSLQERAAEEILLLQTEMTNVYNFYLEQHRFFLCKYNMLKERTNLLRYEKGELCLVKQKLKYLENVSGNLCAMFNPFTTAELKPPTDVTGDNDSNDIGNYSSSESDVSDISDIE